MNELIALSLIIGGLLLIMIASTNLHLDDDDAMNSPDVFLLGGFFTTASNIVKCVYGLFTNKHKQLRPFTALFCIGLLMLTSGIIWFPK